MTGRRELTVAVLAAAAGAGLVLLSASRVWWVQTVAQPAPLRPQDIAHTGASLAPALPALGFVALAGAGGLLATRGPARRVVGGLLAAVALAAAVLIVTALQEPVGLGWPVAGLAGALVIGAAGALAIRGGDRWPVMGSRYARAAGSPEPGRRPDPGSAQPSPAAHARPGGSADTTAQLWDALDRGEDPTRS